MEVHFTPEQLMQLSKIANYNGTDTEQLVKDAALRVAEEDANFRAAVRRGIEQADRGELVSHEEVVSRIERLLQPWIRRERLKRPLADELEDIAKHCASLPVLDPRPADEILGYNAPGLPADGFSRDRRLKSV
jgi:predicted transcriptional regulator